MLPDGAPCARRRPPASAPAQKHALLGMRSTFLGRLKGIIEQRRKITFELHDSVPSSHSGTLTNDTIAKAGAHLRAGSWPERPHCRAAEPPCGLLRTWAQLRPCACLPAEPAGPRQVWLAPSRSPAARASHPARSAASSVAAASPAPVRAGAVGVQAPVGEHPAGACRGLDLPQPDVPLAHDAPAGAFPPRAPSPRPVMHWALLRPDACSPCCPVAAGSSPLHHQHLLQGLECTRCWASHEQGCVSPYVCPSTQLAGLFYCSAHQAREAGRGWRPRSQPERCDP